MPTRLFTAIICTALLLTAASKKPAPSAKGENEEFILTATLHVDPAEIKELIGSDLDSHFVVAEIKVDPKYGKEISIDRDDFMIRSDKDGEKSRPFLGSQIVGQSSLVLSEDGQMKEKKTRWGIGLGGGGMGTAGEGGGGATKATMKTDDQESPLRKVLDAKSLPEKKTTEAVSGLLYFPMEKQKLKDLELIYGGRTENRISLRFK